MTPPEPIIAKDSMLWLDKKSWPTTIDAKAKITMAPLPGQVVVKKSKLLHLLTFLFALTAFFLICYMIVTGYFAFNIVPVVVAAAFLFFLLFAFLGLVNSDTKITITKNSISFSNGQVINWEDVTGTLIERQFFNVSRGNGIERFYLLVYTKFAGGASKKNTPFSFEITGLQYDHNKIGHLVELYKQNFGLTLP